MSKKELGAWINAALGWLAGPVTVRTGVLMKSRLRRCALVLVICVIALSTPANAWAEEGRGYVFWSNPVNSNWWPVWSTDLLHENEPDQLLPAEAGPFGLDKNSLLLLQPAGLVLQMETRAGVACPESDFSSFLQKFANDNATQRAFTHSPLMYISMDIHAEPEPEPVIRALAESEVSFPVMPLDQERKDKSLQLVVIRQDSTRARVKLFKDDSDYLVYYVFRRDKNECWELVEVDDQSL